MKFCNIRNFRDLFISKYYNLRIFLILAEYQCFSYLFDFEFNENEINLFVSFKNSYFY